MKTANERAREIAALTYGVPSASYGKIEAVLKEYAKDQRRLCAEAVSDRDAVDVAALGAVGLAMNAPFPGEPF